MQLNSKEKQKCIMFLNNYKTQALVQPFINKFQTKFGYSDFDLIVTKKLDFTIIQKNLKSGKYPTTKQFYRDMKQLFDNYVLYAFEGDQVSRIAKQCIKQIDQQEATHYNQQYEIAAQPIHKKKKQKQVLVSVPIQHQDPIKKSAANLSEKLEMIYLLRAQQNNFPEIKRIGDYYKVGKMTENQYTVKLEGTNWMQLLMKRN